jgi:hypothetical protein
MRGPLVVTLSLWSVLTTAASAMADSASEPPLEAVRPTVDEPLYPPPSASWKVVALGLGTSAVAYGAAAGLSYAYPDAPGAHDLRIPFAGPWLAIAHNGCGGEPDCSQAMIVFRTVITERRKGEEPVLPADARHHRYARCGCRLRGTVLKRVGRRSRAGICTPSTKLGRRRSFDEARILSRMRVVGEALRQRPCLIGSSTITAQAQHDKPSAFLSRISAHEVSTTVSKPRTPAHPHRGGSTATRPADPTTHSRSAGGER